MQVNYSEETEYVFLWLFKAVYSGQVFEGEKECEHIFQDSQGEIGGVGEYMHAFQYYQYYTQCDAANQNNIE